MSGVGAPARCGQAASFRPFFCNRQFSRILAAAFWTVPAAALAAETPLLAPLGGAISPSATYGELSPGRVHPGIDLPTGGRSLPIAAAAGGEIDRVRVSGAGYGRALHLLLPDGREIVYAHLSRFAPAVEDSCRARQGRSAVFDMDWEPAPGTFPVRAGDPLGMTGETEDGRSLLHLEVRVSGTPRNPLTQGFRWSDASTPRIDALRYVPLSPAASVDGRAEPERVAIVARTEEGPASGSVVLWGPIGVECEAEEAGEGGRRAPWIVRLAVDGQLQFEEDLGARIAEGSWDPDVPEPAGPVLFLQRLYDPSRGNKGRLLCGTVLRPGPHTLRVTVRGVSGRSDSASTAVLVEAMPRVEEWMARPAGDGVWDIGVAVGPAAGADPSTDRLWIDVTDDGRRFPVSTPLGYLGSGWFVGEVEPFAPAGVIGVRARIVTRDGRECRGPTLSLEAAGRCAACAVDSPAVVVTPVRAEIDVAAACMPARAPRGRLAIAGDTLACALQDVPPLRDEDRLWRFRIGPPRRGRTGASPSFLLALDDSTRSWRLPSLVPATPSSDLLWTSPDGALTVEIPAGTFYGPMWLDYRRVERDRGRLPAEEIAAGPRQSPEQEEALLERSDVHVLEPGDAELDGPFRVAIRPKAPPGTPEEARRLCIFGRPDSTSPWRSCGGVWTGSAVVAVVDRLQQWLVLEDRSEPWLYAMTPAPGQRRTGRVSTLSVQVREDGSGVTAAGFQVTLDGAPVPAAWEPGARRLETDLAQPLSSGTHRWEVRARDRAGNLAERAAVFVVVGQP